jgi:hypothetical protein
LQKIQAGFSENSKFFVIGIVCSDLLGNKPASDAADVPHFSKLTVKSLVYKYSHLAKKGV